MGEITILAGDLKGLKVATPTHTPGLRPILAQIKKSLFDILKTKLQDSSFLDLFSGSGAVGLEALSRGAREVIFIEVDGRYFRLLNESIKKMAGRSQEFLKGKECKVYRADVLKGLSWLGKEFDLIFSGAPYVDVNKKPISFVNKLLSMLEKDKLLKKNGLFIAQHHKKETFEVPSHWNLFRQEQYGDTTLSFFKRA